MKALLYYNRRDIRFEELSVPKVEPHQVLIKVTDAGLSQTQVNEFIEGPFILSPEPNALTGMGLPLIPCQEYGGDIVEVGDQVSKQWIGKTVAVLPLVSCGMCEHCEAGNVHFCTHKAYYGLAGAHGGFCEYSAVNSDNVIEVENKSLLTFVEPLLVAAHSYHRYGESLENKKVLVLGAGAVGLSCAAVWRKLGAQALTMYDHLPNRLAKAESLGFNVVDTQAQLVSEFDVVVDAAGKDPLHERQAFEEAPTFLKPGGTVISIGTYFFPISVTPVESLVEEKSYVPSYMYNMEDVELLKDILPDLGVNFDSLITRVPFDKLVEEGYYQAELDRDTFVRIVTSVE
ncbi:alcohol dehydrogenase catalytic domain-containing protein [Vibrio hannami]|uniref:alcohol dehydrogenase catalytic domain-containing protein n=1 Tax=Vibrio hannami TaxID=2717094 RepID=UPI00241093AF|nr:alcohol dehydrogenase catalytic domain-containing protein [Vibrio hannami]MDG3086100.1 alcohol dehydrogenase catalytic domain-containing protein [Vibrio hannami]